MDDAGYQQWRQEKLNNLTTDREIPAIPIGDPNQLTADERTRLLDQIGKQNFVVYELNDRWNRALLSDSAILESLCGQFGLQAPVGNTAANEFGLSRIESANDSDENDAPSSRARYIPYTTRELNWHTDGYYNDETNKVRSFALHCVRSASEGGENAFFDPELLYLLLRDEAPELLPVLCKKDAFRIPMDHSSGRPAFNGPVFSIDPATGCLYTRYTQRKRHIQWLDTPEMKAALDRIENIINGPHPGVIRTTLKPGQGILCNNVLHRRSAFTDHADKPGGRLLYRLRFTQRVNADPEPMHELS